MTAHGVIAVYNHWLLKLLNVNAIVLFQTIYYAMPEEQVDELRDDGDDENDQELIEILDDHPLAILKQYT